MRRLALGVAAVLVLAGCPRPRVGPAGTGPGGDVDSLLSEAAAAFAKRPDASQVRHAMDTFEAAAAADATRVEGCLGVVRAAAWLLEHGPKAERGGLVKHALTAGTQCQERAPGTAICNYWQAVARGLGARENPTTGIGELKVIVELLKKADAAAPQLDDAGPARVLALLLLRAPGWPAGPGDAEAGLAEAKKAVERAPKHPMNHLALAEALVATGDVEGARAAYAKAKELSDALAANGEPDGIFWAVQAQTALGKL